jgi:hypothetical protein
MIVPAHNHQLSPVKSLPVMVTLRRNAVTQETNIIE